MKRFWKNKKFGIITAVLLLSFTTYALLDTFVISRAYSSEGTTVQSQITSGSGEEEITVDETETDAETSATEEESGHHSHSRSRSGNKSSTDSATAETEQSSGSSDTEQTTANSYEDDDLSIQISEYTVADTTVYVADITVSSGEGVQTAFADGTYGKNVKDTTSQIASDAGAVLAINGDFYGARNTGYVIRNGVLYRNTSAGNEDLVIWDDGSMSIISEDEVSAEELLEQGAQQVFSFGPALVEDGEIAVTSGEEVGKAMASNPRTAIGIVEEGHYVFVVSDGRSDESEGLTLYELAQFMESLGVKTAYNLDGGGSSTMVFNGTLINNPTTSGNSVKERSVSDIVYVG